MAGVAKIKPYDADLGANYYLGKKMVTDAVDIFFSEHLMDIRDMPT